MLNRLHGSLNAKIYYIHFSFSYRFCNIGDNESALDNRGTLLVNAYQKYPEALADFNNAIHINPKGHYYLNRSICYYKLGNVTKAKLDAQIAMQKGEPVPDNYRKTLGL